jgi:hypothetical protein
MVASGSSSQIRQMKEPTSAVARRGRLLAPVSVRSVRLGRLWKFVPSFQLGFDELFRLQRGVEMTGLFTAAIVPQHVNIPRAIGPPANM